MGDGMNKIRFRVINFRQFILISGIFSIVIASFIVADTAAMTASSNIEQISVPLIIIDAGHGGEDGGASSASGILEKNINLAISLKIKTLLDTLGFETLMTRTDDSLIYDESCSSMREKKVSDIHNRMSILEKYPNSIFLSIHQNHFSESKYNGAQVFYSKNNSESEVIAEILQQSICSQLQNDNDRMIKPSGTEIYLLYHAKTPAVMVECGFLSNAGEAQKLNDETYQTQMSMAIVDGLINYLNNRT